MRIERLGDVATFASGGTPSKKVADYYDEGTIPWITGADISVGGRVRARTWVTEKALAKTAANAMPAGTIVLVTRTSVGKVGIITERTSYSQDITAIVPSERVDSAYLVRFLESKSKLLQRESRGATIRGVTREIVANLKLPLPGLEEQSRIAEVLDEAHALRAKRRTQIAGLDELPRALFHEMFGGCESRKYLGEVIAEGPTNGLYKPASLYGSGAPILRIDGFSGGAIADREWKRVQASEDDLIRFSLRVDDIIINRVNALSHLGKSTIVEHLDEPSVYESNMMRLRIEPSLVDPVFTTAWLQTIDAKRQILRRAKKAINQASINQTDVRSLSMPVPPLLEQKEFAAKVVAIRAERDRATRGLEADEELLAALQHRAFRGEL